MPNEIISHYRTLRQPEKAFRMSKTDLRIRPVYHRLKHRIEAHICLSLTAYTVYKELERDSKQTDFDLSVGKAAEIIQNICELEVILPQSLRPRKIIPKTDALQTKLLKLIPKTVRGVPLRKTGKGRAQGFRR